MMISGTIVNGGSLINDSNDIVARVIYSEAASASSYEKLLVASVIKNRINHPGYSAGKLASMEQVVLEKGAFSCINDPKNKQWELSSTPEKLNYDDWLYCTVLSRGTFIPRTEATAYHDKSIECPVSWTTNKFYTYIPVIETKHFVFYSVKAKLIGNR